ncbi:13604_t:CDS:2 [Funneliformis mosseae]|uniref:13604_t:CDS:1 n=1 Tax=Funneliformis mosseae TaxID=27381 RepID=A0A9N8ZMR0_FUNMO|nr:13604_t:CDS:2 [Funneliformis mosseae]
MEHAEKAMILNINDYYSIHMKQMPNTTTTSIAAHLATILMKPITTQFMTLLDLSHNQRWGFCSVNNSTKLEELTIHSYDTRLKEKWDAHLMKDVVFIDLQENNLHSLNTYIKAINAIVNVLSMQQYI